MKKRNPQLLVLVGAPGSGKTTFAKYHLRTHLNWARVCRDDFRLMHFSGGNFLSDRDELMITKMIEASIETLLVGRTNVIADATHTKKEYLELYIKKFGHLADVSFKVFDEAPEILHQRCLARQAETGKHIPAAAIKHHAESLRSLQQQFDFSTRQKTPLQHNIRQQDSSLPKAIICDLDGTLALLNGRNPFDASASHQDQLNTPVANLLINYRQSGYKILLVSGREDKYRTPTLQFLEQHSIPYDMLLMRQEGDSRKDAIIKKELFDQELKDKYFIEFILDDRNQVVDMWRNELQLPCFQVFYGDF